MLGTAVELDLFYNIFQKLASTKTVKALISHDTNAVILLADQPWYKQEPI